VDAGVTRIACTRDTFVSRIADAFEGSVQELARGAQLLEPELHGVAGLHNGLVAQVVVPDGEIVERPLGLLCVGHNHVDVESTSAHSRTRLT